MKYDGTTFGHQCDALTKTGERCKNTNQMETRGHNCKPVRLCRLHESQWDRMHLQNCGKIPGEMKRLPLRDGGFFGGWNRFDYGSMVTNAPNVDWDSPDLNIDTPEAWKVTA